VREVSCKASSILLETLSRSGIDVEHLVQGLPVGLEHLRDTSQRIDWDTLATLFNRAEQACEGVITLEELGERALVVPSYAFLRQAAQLVITPRQLYEVGSRLMAPAMFPNIRLHHAWLPAGRFMITGELPEGERESTAFFRVCHGNMVAVPKLLDLPPSQIEEQSVTGRRGRLILVPPRSHTAIARVKRAARTLWTLGDAVRGVRRQQAELEASLDALRSSRHELRQLVERLPEGVLVHRDAHVVWANAAMLALLGHRTLDDIAGKHILSFLVPEEQASVRVALAKVGPRTVNDSLPEYRIARPDGTVRRIQAGTTQHLEFEGALARLVVVRDITERHRLDEQLALADRMASIGTVAAGVAHEINNPLAYVRMNLEVAARELAGAGGPAEAAECIRVAIEGAERVRGIVRNLSTLSRVEEDVLEAVDLSALLDSTLTLAASALTPKARIVRRYDPVPRALGTPGRLGQVFLNLVLNAADAIPEGAAGDHEVRVSTATGVGGHAIVEIADTGGGISFEHAGRVFDPFFTTKPVGAGTGLGLAICHRIVTGLGGEIGFTARTGGGTVFRVSLPPASNVEAVSPTTAGDPPPSPRGRVLVVDDEPALLRSLRAMLGSDHEVVTASSGHEALEVLRDDARFDVVLTDLMMPSVTGMDLYDAIRRAHPEMERRIVFMTGGAFTPRAREFLATVPNRCMEKPFERSRLLATLGEVIAA
jgi:two-component system cell cycle sensor histidine kinase/response regulator CckA